MNYDYRFIIKELAKEFEGEVNYLGENTEKYKTFSTPIKKKLKGLIIIEKKLQKNYMLHIRFIANFLPNLVDNLAE